MLARPLSILEERRKLAALRKSEVLWGLYKEQVKYDTAYCFPFINQGRVAGFFRSSVIFDDTPPVKINSSIAVNLNNSVTPESLIFSLVHESVHVAICGALTTMPPDSEFVEAVINDWMLNTKLVSTSLWGELTVANYKLPTRTYR